MVHRVTFALVALILALAMIAPGSVPPRAHAAAPRDQNVGRWDYTCRVRQVNTYETITVGADAHGPMGSVSGFVAQLCTAFTNVSPDAYNNGYEFFPLTQPRPGAIQCGYVYRYGGYWELLHAPYTNSLGATVITVRDTNDDTLPGMSDSTYGGADCSSIGIRLDQINIQNGYNVTAEPLAPSQNCAGCGGGGGAAPGGFTGTLPNPPKAKHPAKKPLKCIVDTLHGNKKTCHR